MFWATFLKTFETNREQSGGDSLRISEVGLEADKEKGKRQALILEKNKCLLKELRPLRHLKHLNRKKAWQIQILQFKSTKSVITIISNLLLIHTVAVSFICGFNNSHLIYFTEMQKVWQLPTWKIIPICKNARVIHFLSFKCEKILNKMFFSQSWLYKKKKNPISHNITSLSYLWSPIKFLHEINQTNLHKYIALILYSAIQRGLLSQESKLSQYFLNQVSLFLRTQQLQQKNIKEYILKKLFSLECMVNLLE